MVFLNLFLYYKCDVLLEFMALDEVYTRFTYKNNHINCDLFLFCAKSAILSDNFKDQSFYLTFKVHKEFQAQHVRYHKIG